MDESAEGLGRCADKLVCVEGLTLATVFRPATKVLCRCSFPVGALTFKNILSPIGGRRDGRFNRCQESKSPLY